MEHALALYDKVVDIWYKFLINLRHRPDESISDYLSEAHTGEAVEMLKNVLETRKKYLGSQHIATGEGAYCLGILKHITGFDEDARALYKQALVIYERQLGPDNESTLAILRALADLPEELLAPEGEEEGGEGGEGGGEERGRILQETLEMPQLTDQTVPCDSHLSLSRTKADTRARTDTQTHTDRHSQTLTDTRARTRKPSRRPPPQPTNRPPPSLKLSTSHCLPTRRASKTRRS